MDRRSLRWLIVAVVMLQSGMVFAQSNAPERGITVVPSEPPPAAPTEPDRPAIQRVTPPMPSSVDNEAILDTYRRQQSTGSVDVKAITVTGNTVLVDAEIEAVTAPYVGRSMSLEEIEALRRKLTLLYIDRGFVNSGVVLAQQPLTSAGVLQFDVVEGRLTSIELTGNRHLTDGYIERRLKRKLGPVLNIGEIEQSLRLMQSWPTIAAVNAEVLPGSTPGTGVLDLQIRENNPVTLAFGADNHRSPSVGENQGVVSLTHRSLTHHGDYLIANYGVADGLDNLYVAYGLPLTAADLTFEGHYSEGQSDIVEAPFDTLDIVSDTESYGGRLFRPMIKTLTQLLTLSLEFEHKKSRSSLLGVPFSFSPGEVDGGSKVSAVRAGVEWSRRWTRDALAMRLKISKGVDWLDATDNSALPGDLPDSDFTAVLLQAEYVHQFAWRNAQLLGRITAQGTDDPLLPVEKLAVGGGRTVRGYRENLLVRDEGVIASIEARVPLFPDDAGASRIGLSVAPFVDFGVARDRLESLASSESQDLLSAGAGLLWNPWRPLNVEVYYGHRFEDVDDTGDGLQDDGVHFRVTFGWSF
ncbi:MAG: BamA/TamA family outer membrane protein [Pseudomonadota bacterium]|nr:BamA/TamA family outer membrane protein [Pseudomonadota bacterium]